MSWQNRLRKIRKIEELEKIKNEKLFKIQQMKIKEFWDKLLIENDKLYPEIKLVLKESYYLPTLYQKYNGSDFSGPCIMLSTYKIISGRSDDVYIKYSINRNAIIAYPYQIEMGNDQIELLFKNLCYGREWYYEFEKFHSFLSKLSLTIIIFIFAFILYLWFNDDLSKIILYLKNLLF